MKKNGKAKSINAFRVALFTARIVHCIAILRPIVQHTI